MLCNTDEESTYISGVTNSVKLWEPRFRKTTQTIVMHSSASSPPQVTQSIVDLGFQHSLLPFPTVSGHCLCFFFISNTLKSSSNSTLHLSHGRPLFLLLPLQLLQFVLAFSGFAFFRPQPRIKTTK